MGICSIHVHNTRSGGDSNPNLVLIRGSSRDGTNHKPDLEQESFKVGRKLGLDRDSCSVKLSLCLYIFKYLPVMLQSLARSEFSKAE